MSESKEVDRFWPLCLPMSKSPELNQPGFVRLQLQTKLAQPPWQHIHETFRITAVLKALLRAAPPQCMASVLSPLWFWPLGSLP